MKKILIFCLCLVSCSPVVPLEDPFDRTIQSHQVSERSADPKMLRLLAIDVGQGDATLVIGPSGKTLLIDAGPAYEQVCQEKSFSHNKKMGFFLV